MRRESYYVDAMRHTRILLPAKHTIATFGTTTLRYVLLSVVPGEADYCRLREGEVTAQRPKILTPEFWKTRFQGFGDDPDRLQEEFEKTYGEALRGLEYSFKNDLKTTSLEHAPLPEVADRARKAIEAKAATRTALLEGPDGHWPVSVLKFIVDTSLRSFPSNLRELDERGLFDPEKTRQSRHRYEIEKLFQRAQADRSQITSLAEMLKQTGMFAEYEDRFFGLVGR